jgi:hypothetical protein
MTADWLRDQLACGPKPIAELYALAGKRGLSESTLRRAAKHLNVVRDDKLWQLPADGQRSNADGQP